jgi:prepilin-type N-terminal cleavage/methylation domain-containing protein
MKNNKGFTLVELLAMLVVIGILMVVTIPNITGIMKNNRLNGFKGDAKQMVEKTNIMVSKSKDIKKPQNRECLIFTLDYLNTNDDLTSGPNGGLYNQEESFVVYTRNGQKYEYYIRLIEEVDGRKIGISLVNSDEIENLTTDSIKEIEELFGITKEQTPEENINLLTVDAVINNHCDTIKNFYIRN